MNLIAKELLAFDLDGTLIDSSGDIAWTANRTLSHFGYEPQSPESVKSKIGSGVVVLLERLMPEEGPGRIAEAKEIFLKHYAGHLVVDTHLYPGVMETLAHFRDMGKSMAIVTNKPRALAGAILDELGLGDFFGVVAGGDTFPNRKPHPEPLEEVMRASGVKPARTAFVGDSLIDAETGLRAGVFTVGVSYGFGGSGVGAAGFSIVIDAFRELKGIIC
jgi:phosphoglycolate phosphatase